MGEMGYEQWGGCCDPTSGCAPGSKVGIQENCYSTIELKRALKLVEGVVFRARRARKNHL